MKHTNKRWNDVVCKAHDDYVCMRKSQTGEVIEERVGGGGVGRGGKGWKR